MLYLFDKCQNNLLSWSEIQSCVLYILPVLSQCLDLRPISIPIQKKERNWLELRIKNKETSPKGVRGLLTV